MVMEVFRKNANQKSLSLDSHLRRGPCRAELKSHRNAVRGSLLLRGKMITVQILGLLLHTTAAMAQRKTPEEKAARFTAEMCQVILLDSLCRSRVHEVNLWLSKSFDSLYATHPDPETKRRAYIYFFRSRDSFFRGILNREQFLRYDDWQREQRLKRQEEKRRENEKQKEGAMQGTIGEQPLTIGSKAYRVSDISACTREWVAES